MSSAQLALSPIDDLARASSPERRPWRLQTALSLKSYLLALAAAIVLPLLTLAVVEALDSIHARQHEATLQMQLLLADSAHGVEQGLAGMTSTAEVLAGSPSLIAGDLKAFRQEADDVATARGVDIVLRDASGAQVVSTRVPPGAPLPSLPPEDRQARLAVNAGQDYVSDIYASGMTHPFLARIVVPAAFKTGRGMASGYSLEVAFTPRAIGQWLNDSGRPNHWIVCVIGRNGQLLSHSGDPDAYVGRGSAMDSFGPIKGFSGQWQSFDFVGDPITGMHMKLTSGWTVAVGAPNWLLTRPLRKAFIWLGIVAAVLIFGAIASSLWVARRISESVEILESDALALGEGRIVTPAALPMRDLAFVQAALCSAGRDLATRRVTERTLLADVQAGRDLLQAVVDGSGDLIFARDFDDRIVLANQASAELFGLEIASDATGRKLEDLLKAATGGDMPELRPSGQSSAPAYVTMPDGRSFEVRHSTLRDGAGIAAGTISIARDVTERVAASARMQRLQSDLARAGRLSAVAAMGAGLAHELHQPLSAAANFLAVAMRRLSAMETTAPAAAAPIAAAMTEASGQVLRTGEILQRLRGFIGETEMEAAPLADIVREAAEAAWRHAASERGRMHLHLAAGIEVLVDKVSIQQVVSNLVRNAAEAIGPAEGDIWIVSRLEGDGSALVSVMDSGAGIDPAAADRLFDVFSGSSKAGGLGVGLAICRTIISAHGGWISASNHAAGGAAFTFTLPPRPAVLAPAEDRRAA